MNMSYTNVWGQYDFLIIFLFSKDKLN